ncbi:hypothetical protein JFT91_19930 [Pseudomonas sp. TH08]|uniref:hypothetical protein n=1 Tax=unclassified Pseudomonas TaxID=196821 RepID=UPI001913E1B2|nr:MULTISPECIES: hypothetical protein [unclassified Pseudomonas]MBK5529727.1 hypothetical protein [Pseudomonas sp. TH06]MBK5534830.1 hypothetical protein [Pseudomonas sp. TH08]
MKTPTWFIPLSESLSTLLKHGATPDSTNLSRYEVASILYVLQLSKPLKSPAPSALDLERKFATILAVPSDQLRAALTESYNQAAFIAGLARISDLGIGLVDKKTISNHPFIRPEGDWDFDFARRYRDIYGAISHEHVRPGGAIIRLSDHQLRLIHNIRANLEDSIETQALAGTGKTFVLDEVMALMPEKRFIFMTDAEPKLKAIRARFTAKKVPTSTFKRLAESTLSGGNEFLQNKMEAESRLPLSYSQLAEQVGLGPIGNRGATQVAALCWSVIFKFCMSKDRYITSRHIPLDQIRWLSMKDQEIVAAVSVRLWNQLIQLDMEAPSLPVRGYHRIKQMSLENLYIPERFDTVLIDESHDLSAPMVVILDKSPQTVISLGDQFQNLEGQYVPHSAIIRHREMATSLRAGPPLVEYINPLLEIFPDASSSPFMADKAKEMVVRQYSADAFPPEASVILVADNWGIFDWLLRSREMGKGAAVIDWNRDVESFLSDCWGLFMDINKPTHGALARYRTWDQLHEAMKWNHAFLRVERWLSTVGVKIGVSGLYKRASHDEFANHLPIRPLLATVFAVKNFEFKRMAISEDLYYSPDLLGKRVLSKKLALLYTAITRACGEIYFPDTHQVWMDDITRAAGSLR